MRPLAASLPLENSASPAGAACVQAGVTELWLIRHGETEWNRQHRVQGDLNIALNEMGVRQANQVAGRLAREAAAAHAIHSSDLDRAHHTARPTAMQLALAITLDAGLRERSYGIFQGLSFDELNRRHPAAALAVKSRDPDYALEGGESLRTFQQRVVGTLDAIARQRRGQRALVFTHGGVLDMAYRYASAIALETPGSHPLRNGSINRIEIGDGGWRVLDWGDIGHLENPADDD